MKNLKKSLLVAAVVCFIVVVFSTVVQLIGQNKLTIPCSYLDPVIIDVLALSAGIFLIIEGLVKIFLNHNATLLKQTTRIIRIAFGFAIITLHIIQILHK